MLLQFFFVWRSQTGYEIHPVYPSQKQHLNSTDSCLAVEWHKHLIGLSNYLQEQYTCLDSRSNYNIHQPLEWSCLVGCSWCRIPPGDTDVLCCRIQQTPTGSSQQSPAAEGHIRGNHVDSQRTSVNTNVNFNENNSFNNCLIYETHEEGFNLMLNKQQQDTNITSMNLCYQMMW